jgi:DNA-binding transcriptional LysR family regulator
MLDLRRLRALHAVVTTGSVKDAAAQLGYTPSAVSQHITMLERETSMVLLEPAGRGVRPTAAGRLLAGRSLGLLDLMAETEAELAALKAGDLGILRLASFATAGAELVPPALAMVKAALPHLEISLRVAERDDALATLRRGMLDAAIVEAHALPAGEALHGDLMWDNLLSDPFRIALPRDHRLARRRIIKLREVADESWVDVKCEVGCCRAATDAAFRQAGFIPRRAVQADDYWPAQGFVAAGLGIALIPALALGVLHDGVVVRRLEDAIPERQVMAVTRPAVAGTVPVQAIIAALRTAAGNRRLASTRPDPHVQRLGSRLGR